MRLKIEEIYRHISKNWGFLFPDMYCKKFYFKKSRNKIRKKKGRKHPTEIGSSLKLAPIPNAFSATIRLTPCLDWHVKQTSPHILSHYFLLFMLDWICTQRTASYVQNPLSGYESRHWAAKLEVSLSTVKSHWAAKVN